MKVNRRMSSPTAAIGSVAQIGCGPRSVNRTRATGSTAATNGAATGREFLWAGCPHPADFRSGPLAPWPDSALKMGYYPTPLSDFDVSPLRSAYFRLEDQPPYPFGPPDRTALRAYALISS